MQNLGLNAQIALAAQAVDACIQAVQRCLSSPTANARALNGGGHVNGRYIALNLFELLHQPCANGLDVHLFRGSVIHVHSFRVRVQERASNNARLCDQPRVLAHGVKHDVAPLLLSHLKLGAVGGQECRGIHCVVNDPVGVHIEEATQL
jgi:hypothetical protein